MIQTHEDQLQWGRGHVTAESLVHLTRIEMSRRASMGPRSRDRGISMLFPPRYRILKCFNGAAVT